MKTVNELKASRANPKASCSYDKRQQRASNIKHVRQTQQPADKAQK